MNPVNKNHWLWCEKWRPQVIDDCVLPAATKETFKQYVLDGNIPSMILCGGPGSGKTTSARALCNETKSDWMIINCSDENGIDVLRTKIKQFASTVSFSDAKKVVILDESDYLSPNAQAAFRGLIEEYAKNCTFIFTCNYKNKLIEPLHSRCVVFDYKIPTVEKPSIAKQVFQRMCYVLTEESITFDKKVVAELVQKYFPDFRRMLNEMQRYSAKGTIDTGILIAGGNDSYAPLMEALKEKKYADVRKWVSQNSDIDSAKIFRDLYDILHERVSPKSFGNMVLTIADYSYRSAFVADQEINTVAALVTLMMDLEFK